MEGEREGGREGGREGEKEGGREGERERGGKGQYIYIRVCTCISEEREIERDRKLFFSKESFLAPSSSPSPLCQWSPRHHSLPSE